MTNIFHDQSAQALPISYILTFTLSVGLLVIVIISYHVMVAGTSKQAMRVSYADIGNDVAGTIADIYLTASAGSTGNVTRTIRIPTEVAGEGYIIEPSDSPFTTEYNPNEAIKISAEHANVVVYVPLSNIDQSIDVSGKAYSGAGELKVEYDINKTITLS
ncbi:MAG: hypothetical protein QMC85_00545 [Methanocellales archaeon]|nr:hypothetical protein [Methanocellales archaeon]